jgi:hypothetical protein
MGVLFDLLIPLLIILGIAWAALRSFMDRGKGEPPRVNALRPGASVAERTSMERPARENVVSPASYTRDPVEAPREVQEPRRRASQASTISSSTRARALRRTLRNPESFRTAFILKELLGPPVGLGKDEHPADRA